MKGFKMMLSWIVGISGLALMLWFIMPAVHYSFTYVPVAIFCAVLTGIAFFTQRSNQHRFVYIFLPCLLLALLYYVVPYNLQLKPAVNIFQQLVMFTAPAMFFTILVSCDKSNEKNARIRRFSTYFILGCIALVFVLTMHELSVFPKVCRALASGDRTDELMALRMRNIGGFGFSYAMGIVEILTFYYSLTSSKKRDRIISIIATVIIFIFIIRSQYMTLFVLCTIVDLLICLKFAKGFGSKLLIVMAVLFVIALADPITSLMSKIFAGSTLSDKFYSISGIFDGAAYSSMRTEYIKDCLESFSNNPLVGKFNLINDLEASHISNMSHSTQLKILVDTGLVGFLLYNTYLVYMRHYIVKQLRLAGANPEPFITCFWFLWILSWLNPVFQVFELPFALFLVVPLVIYFNAENNKSLRASQEHHDLDDDTDEIGVFDED